MKRVLLLVLCALSSALLAVPAGAEDPSKKLTPEERKELEARRKELNDDAVKAEQAGQPAPMILHQSAGR